MGLSLFHLVTRLQSEQGFLYYILSYSKKKHSMKVDIVQRKKSEGQMKLSSKLVSTNGVM
jgi:hypothetical protein